MFLKFICCDVFLRIACDTVSKSPHVIDVEFVPMLSHTEPDVLRKDLQERIDRSVKIKEYDKIILGYGLCGNATIGLQSPIPLILPRTHDCCLMFMGSKKRYLDKFGGNLSMRWCTCGYYERCNMIKDNPFENQNAVHMTNGEYMDLVEKYGEENADYIWETMHPNIETDEAAYIEIDGFEYSDSFAKYKTDIESRGKTLRHLKGDITYLTRLINGPWDANEFLEVMPEQTVKGVYDMDIVMKAE